MYGISEVVSMKIGMMGGTFDPIHNGHLHLAQTALTQFDLDQIWFMPNGMPPHKKQSSIESDIHERIAMTQIAIKANKQFYLQEYEAKREKVSYSYKTMEHFRKMYPDDEFYFIIGADSLFSIETWKHPERLFKACIILAACRDEAATKESLNGQIQMLKFCAGFFTKGCPRRKVYQKNCSDSPGLCPAAGGKANTRSGKARNFESWSIKR